MSRTLAVLLLVTDVLFLAYWSISALAVAGAFALPHDLMYAGYGEPRVTAWNWSFLPLDVLFSIAGIAAVRLARAGSPTWRPVALVSLSLTFVAGLMAASYWTILREFDPAWFLPNLLLMIWPLFFLPSLLRR